MKTLIATDTFTSVKNARKLVAIVKENGFRAKLTKRANDYVVRTYGR